MSPVRSTLLFSLTLVPLLAGAVYLTATGQGPEKSWSAGEEPQAAPAAARAQLMEARRAAIDAGTLDEDRFAHYLKLREEVEGAARTLAQRRAQKGEDKAPGRAPGKRVDDRHGRR